MEWLIIFIFSFCLFVPLPKSPAGSRSRCKEKVAFLVRRTSPCSRKCSSGQPVNCSLRIACVGQPDKKNCRSHSRAAAQYLISPSCPDNTFALSSKTRNSCNHYSCHMYI